MSLDPIMWDVLDDTGDVVGSVEVYDAAAGERKFVGCSYADGEWAWGRALHFDTPELAAAAVIAGAL